MVRRGLLLTAAVAAALPAVSAEPAFRASEVERVFERRGGALVTAAFQSRAPAGGAAVPLPASDEFALVIAGRSAPLRATDLASGEPRPDGDALEIVYAKVGEPLRVTVRHEPGPTPVTLRKRLEIENSGDAPVTIDEIHLESFRTDPKPAAGGRGQPFIIGDRLFLGVEHPIAEQAVVDGRAVARHFPAATIPPGGRLASKSCVAGIAAPGSGLTEGGFEQYIISIAHRKPDHFAWVYNTWAAHDHLGVDRVDGKQVWLDEPLLTRLVDAHERLHQAGIRFDYFQIDAGLDGIQNSLLKFLPDRKPAWLDPQLARVKKLGMKTGVWTELNEDFDKGGRETDYAKTWDAALQAALEDPAFGILKLDFCTWIKEPWHEAERNADRLIGMLAKAREKRPGLMVVAFNGINLSPWWLPHFDTQYVGDPRPSPWPTLRLRHSIFLYTDTQVHALRAARYPWHTIDDCGVLMGKMDTIYWLGTEDWRDSLVLTLARGGRLPFLYGAIDSFTDEDVKFLEYMQLLSRNKLTDLHNQTLPILGSPAKLEVYGWANVCGQEMLVALYNPSFEPREARVNFRELLPDAPDERIPRFAHNIHWRRSNEWMVVFGKDGRFELSMKPFEVMWISFTLSTEHRILGGGNGRLERAGQGNVRLPCPLARADKAVLDPPDGLKVGDNPFTVKSAHVGTVTIPAGTAGKTLALPLVPAKYQVTRAALRIGEKTIWLAQTPRAATPRIWSECGWTTFHAALDPAWKGKTAEVIVISAERRKEETMDAHVYILDEPTPTP
jgi:hypothetical protein